MRLIFFRFNVVAYGLQRKIVLRSLGSNAPVKRLLKDYRLNCLFFGFPEMSGVWHETEVSSADDTDGETSAGAVIPNLTSRWKDKQEKSEWLTGSWPLKEFDGSLPTNKRKAEWIRYRDQFERIASCKAQVDANTRLTGLKIFAGDYLLSIIEMQQKTVTDSNGDIYQATVTALNKYFNQTCDKMMERIKFRDMRMDVAESFIDWVLRLENQAKFCDFGPEQREEEFIQALLRRSVPGIAEKLYEMSDFLGNDLERIIKHGKHLDYIRVQANEVKVPPPESQGSSASQQEAAYAVDVRSGNAPRYRKQGMQSNQEVGEHSRDRSRGLSRGFKSESFNGRKRTWSSPENPDPCSNCGRVHGPKNCRAFSARCYICNKVGHFAEFCSLPKGSTSRTTNERNRMRTGRNEVLKREAGMINQVDKEESFE